MSAAKQLSLESLENSFHEAGIPTKRTKDGDLLAKCFDATFEYLTGNREPYFAPLLCRCPQREYPHELSVHAELRSEWFAHRKSPRWPWSLMLSLREEPSTERRQRDGI